MKIRYNIAQVSYQLSRLEIVLSKEAKVRLSWFDYYRNHQHNTRLTFRPLRDIAADLVSLAETL